MCGPVPGPILCLLGTARCPHTARVWTPPILAGFVWGVDKAAKPRRVLKYIVQQQYSDINDT